LGERKTAVEWTNLKWWWWWWYRNMHSHVVPSANPGCDNVSKNTIQYCRIVTRTGYEHRKTETQKKRRIKLWIGRKRKRKGQEDTSSHLLTT
jgi:hypothetical protein